MPIQVPVTQTGLEASIEAAAKRAGRSLKVNMGPGAKSIEGLSQPLGRITGKADQFTKSMEAANARVLAFGASVGVLSAVQRGFADLVKTTVEVEKSLASINSILGTTTKELNQFKATIFEVARNTEQSFDTVATAALELSRQGLKAEEVTKRLNDSLVLSRLSGLGAAEAVAGLASAINSFNSTGITIAEVLNKLSAAAVSAAVSERDLIEGIKRSGAVAIQAGVSFDELVGVITAVQERTARGGAVIGNSFKTIFTRIQSLDKLETMQNLGVQVTDASGQVLSATKLIQNLGKTLATLPDAKRLQIAENLVGKFQIAPFLAILEDYNRETSTAIKVTEIASKATNEAYGRNVALNKTLSAAINEATVNLKELANTLGEIGVTDSLRNILGFFNTLVGDIKGLLDGDGVGSDFAKGFVKAIGGIISGPGLAIFGAIIAKLTLDLAKFGVGSLKTFFGLNRAAKEQATLQGQIASTLLGNESIQKAILDIENSQLSAADKRKAQTQFFTTALNEQFGIMQKMQAIAAKVTPGVMAGTRMTGKGAFGRGAGGYIPNFNAVLGYGSEQSDINRGVGGAPKSARPVTIPNFNFGGGQKGTMVANTSEYMVPNFAGTGGSAIFNQDMVASMGLPAGARKIGAAGGYIPNFAQVVKTDAAGMIIPLKRPTQTRGKGTFGKGKSAITYDFPIFGIDAAGEKVREEKDIKRSVEKFSIGLATAESKSMTGGRPTAGKINRLANQGAIGSLSGAIFETALSSLLKSKDFDFGETATFDYVGQAAINNIGDISPALKKSGIKFLDAKIGDNSGTRNSMAKKIFSYFGASAKGKSLTGKGIKELMGASGKGQKEVLGALGMRRQKAASGYIPNFASPLEDAIGREKAAGLPINQIRINQDPTLRNAGNPMGLAVTNTRDEPTGAIPNFAERYPAGTVIDGKKVGGQFKKLGDAAGKSTDQLNKNTKGQRDLLGPIFAAQIAMSAFNGATSDATSGVGLFMKRLSGGLSGLTTAAFAGSALKSFGDSMTNAQGNVTKFGKTLGMVGVVGAALGGAVSMIDAFSKMNEDATGVTEANALAVAKMADAAKNAAISLNTLSEVKKVEITEALKEAFGGDTGTLGSLGVAFGGFLSMGLANFGKGDLFTQAEIENQAAGTVQVKQSEQKVIAQNAAQAVAAMTQMEGISTEEAIARVASIVREEAGRSLAAGQADEDFTGREGGSSVKRGALIANQKEVAAINDRLIAIFKKQNEEKEKALKKDRQALKDAAAIAEKKKVEARINSTLFKEQVRFTIERAKLNKEELNSIEDQVANAEALGDITSSDLEKLKERKAILQAETESRDSQLDTVLKMIQTTGELTTKTVDSARLQDRLVSASLDGVISERERADILKLVNKTLEENTDEKATQLRLLNNDIRLNTLGLEIDKQRLREITKRTQEIKRQQDLDFSTNTTLQFQREERTQKALTPLQEEEARIRGDLARRGAGLKTGFGQEAFGLSEAQAQRRLTQISNETLEITALDADIQKTQQELTSLVSRVFNTPADKAAAQVGLNMEGVTTRKQLMEFLQFDPEKGIGNNFITALDAKAGLGNEGVEQTLKSLRLELESETEARERNAQTALDEADARIQNTDAIKGQFSVNQLLQNIAFDLRNNRNQSLLDARLSTDPAERAKLGISNKNFTKKFNAAMKGDAEGLRLILEQEEFSGKLIDASAQFAQNIGRAMTDAIAKGESLGGLLRSAAADFFNTLSQAFMQKAVNSIIGEGSGSGGGFFGGILKSLTLNSGGPVTGGSGTRDDVPALLTGGEFVMKKGAVQKYGAGFMAALNQGQIPTLNRGGLFTPGTYGQGAMKGKSNLLNFATQGFTTGAFDSVSGGAGFASVALEPQSAALTMFGRRNSPQFAQEQASKRSAFGLYVQQVNKEKQMREQEKQANKGLLGSILSFGAAFALNSLFSGKPKKSATGGSIPYAAGVDTVPAMLSGGEFVMNAAATQRIGRGNLASINSGGGSSGNGAVIGKLDELISVSDNQGETTINITVNSDGTSSENGNGNEEETNLATRIRDVVKQVIDDEKRLGGSLRQARA